MNILVIGGGPAGLSFAYSLRKRDSGHNVHILERLGDYESAGWGITLSPKTLDLIGCDAESCNSLDLASLSYAGEHYLVTPIKLISISRDILVCFLRKQCRSVGVRISFQAPVVGLDSLDLCSFDLVVAADGINSMVRQAYSQFFGPVFAESTMSHVWLATNKLFGRTLLTSLRPYRGNLYSGWGYQFNDSRSSFIVESTSRGLEEAELTGVGDDQACRRISAIFDAELGGEVVITKRHVMWKKFMFVRNKRWYHKNIVLIGDAAHSMHFSKGSGTENAIRDGIALSTNLLSARDVSSALKAFENERMSEIVRLQARATSSHNWYQDLLNSYDVGSQAAVVRAINEAREAALSLAHGEPSTNPQARSRKF